jgi:hypothetical protein
MPFYFGKSADGSDIQEFPGFHVSPNGKYWSTEPITEEEEKEMKLSFGKPKMTRRERRALERFKNK